MLFTTWMVFGEGCGGFFAEVLGGEGYLLGKGGMWVMFLDGWVGGARVGVSWIGVEWNGVEWSGLQWTAVALAGLAAGVEKLVLVGCVTSGR